MKTKQFRIPPGSPLLEYRASTSENDQHICWDCEKDFGVRFAAVVRGVNEDGEFGIFWICLKCARKEAREIRTGMRTWRRRFCYLGRLFAITSLLSVVTDLFGAVLGVMTSDWTVLLWSLLGIPLFIAGGLLSMGFWRIKHIGKLRKVD